MFFFLLFIIIIKFGNVPTVHTQACDAPRKMDSQKIKWTHVRRNLEKKSYIISPMEGGIAPCMGVGVPLRV